MKSNHVVSSSFSWPSKKISWSSKEEVSLGKNVLYLVARWFFKNAPIHSSTSVSCPVSQHELNISSTYTQKQMVWFSLSFFFFDMILNQKNSYNPFNVQFMHYDKMHFKWPLMRDKWKEEQYQWSYLKPCGWLISHQAYI